MDFIKEYILSKVAFWVCLLTSLVLLALGFFMPPMGEISPSVLTATGEMFGFATLAVVADGVRGGLDIKATHGNTTIEIDGKND